MRERTGFEIRVLSGYEEAMLDYRGAVRSLPGEEGLLVDVGGGSTELVFFNAGGRAAAARSVPLGSLSLFNKCVSGIIPTAGELPPEGRGPQSPRRRLPGRAGLCGAAHVRRRRHGARRAGALPRHGGRAAAEGYETQFFSRVLRQAQDSPKKLTRRILKIAPERIHTMLPGIALLSAAAELYGSRTVVTSPYGVREGYLLSVLETEESAYEPQYTRRTAS